MADSYGLMPQDYIDDLERLSTIRYGQVIIATLMAYDIIYLIPQQVQYLHRRKWSKLHLIYFSVLSSNCIGIVMNSYTVNKAWASRSWCLFGWSLALDLTTMLTSLVLKTLLVIRLRAIWNKNFIVTLILCFISAVEILAGLSLVIVYVYIDSVDGMLFPLHGCWINSTRLVNIQNSLASGFDIIRATTTAIEVLLTLIRFTMTYRTQMVLGDGIRSRISHMKTSTRLLYVFYRDGTILFIPLLAYSIMDATYFLKPSATILNILFYSSFFIYPFIVSRLILNLLEANCPVDESIYSMTLESLRFYHSESSRDAEADTSRGDGGAISLGEIHEEER